MRWSNTRLLASIGMIGTLLLASGCVSTRINFDGPPGSVMFVNDKPYHLPAQVEVVRPASVGDSPHEYKVRAVFPMQSGELRAEGPMKVYAFNESDADKMVGITCRFDEEQLANLANGGPLIYKVNTSSRQLFIDLTLIKR